MVGNREINTLPSIDLTPKKRNKRDKRPPKPMPFDVALRKFKKAWIVMVALKILFLGLAREQKKLAPRSH